MPAFDYRGKHYANPVQFALEIIGGKWKMPILWRLDREELRFAELRTSLNAHLSQTQVTDKMLTAHLKDLERDGLIDRRVDPSSPPRVSYSITDRGRLVLPAIRALQHLGNELHGSMARDEEAGTGDE